MLTAVLKAVKILLSYCPKNSQDPAVLSALKAVQDAEKNHPHKDQIQRLILIILNFALAYDLIVANTLFRKRVSHLVTFNGGQHCKQIDFILARREDRHACLDCKVIPGECVVPQYKLVIADFRFRVHLQRSKRVQTPRTKWWKLKEEAAKMFNERVLKEGPWHEEGDANSMLMKMSTCVRKVASEEFRVTKGGKCETKETWWWNENVQNAIKEKKKCFSRMHLDRSVDNVE
jgi:hypothetical protein